MTALARSDIHRYTMIGALMLTLASLPFSVKICHAGVFLLTLNWIAEGHWSEKFSRLKANLSSLPFILFFIWTAVGIFYSENSSDAWFALEKKFTFFLVPVVLSSSAPLEDFEVRSILKSFVGSCIAATVVCFGMAAYRWQNLTGGEFLNFDYYSLTNYRNLHPLASDGWLYFSYKELSEGVGMHPTYLSVYLLLSILIITLELRPHSFFRTERIGYLIAVIYLLIFISLLSSRVVMLTIFIMGVVFGVMHLINQKFAVLKAVGGVTAMLLFFATLTALNPVSRYRGLEEIKSTPLVVMPDKEYINSTEIRLSLWFTGLYAVGSTNLLVGAGPGDLRNVMQQQSSMLGISNILQTYDPHNQYLYTWLASGAVGLALLIACLGFPLMFKRIRIDTLHLGFLGIVAITCLTESFLELQKGIVFFVMFQCLLSYRASQLSAKISS